MSFDKFSQITEDVDKIKVWDKVLNTLKKYELGYNYDIEFCRLVLEDLNKHLLNPTSTLHFNTSEPCSESIMRIALARAFKEDLEIQEGYWKIFESIGYMLRNRIIYIVNEGEHEGEIMISEDMLSSKLAECTQDTKDINI